MQSKYSEIAHLLIFGERSWTGSHGEKGFQIDYLPLG